MTCSNKYAQAHAVQCSTILYLAPRSSKSVHLCRYLYAMQMRGYSFYNLHQEAQDTSWSAPRKLPAMSQSQCFDKTLLLFLRSTQHLVFSSKDQGQSLLLP